MFRVTECPLAMHFAADITKKKPKRSHIIFVVNAERLARMLKNTRKNNDPSLLTLMEEEIMTPCANPYAEGSPLRQLARDCLTSRDCFTDNEIAAG